MKFRPLHDRVLIKVLDSEEKTAGGIIIPDTAKEKPQEGEVVAVGPGEKTEGGKISPMDGIGPNDLNIQPLVDKVKQGKVKELIFALGSTMEGDTTNFYIYKQVQEFNVVTSTIARGISVGNELEYTDEITLGRSIVNRIPFESSLKS